MVNKNKVEEVRLSFPNHPQLSFSYEYRNFNILHDYTVDGMRDFYREHAPYLLLLEEHEPMDVAVMVNGSQAAAYTVCWDSQLWKEFFGHGGNNAQFDVFMANLIMLRFKETATAA